MDSSTSTPLESLPDDTLLDRLLAHLNLHVSGACGPNHSRPLELFYPDLRSYSSDVNDTQSPRRLASREIEPGGTSAATSWLPERVGSFRAIHSAAARDGVAVVQDQDISAVWRLPSVEAAHEVFFWEKAFEASLARETIAVAVEAFEEEVPGVESLDLAEVLQRFGDFLATLGKQPVTIPVSSLVDRIVDMYASARAVSTKFEAFAWAGSRYLRNVIEDFVLTRECFFFPPNRLPVVEATFYAPTHPSIQDVSVTMHYSWNPPTVEFQDLRNVYSEGQTFTLEPILDRATRCLFPALDVQYTTELDSHLEWNQAMKRFEGHVPPQLAGLAGAQRLEAFTMPLNIRAHVTKHFPGGMRFERTIRLSVPVTIKRKPDTCLQDSELSRSPEVHRPAFSRLTTESPDQTFASLERMSAPLQSSPAKSLSPASTPRRDSRWGCFHDDMSDDKENSPLLSGKVLGELLAKKAKEGGPASPLRLTSLSLARLWEATAPQPGTSEVECWAMHVDSQSFSPRTALRNERLIPVRRRLPLRSKSGNPGHGRPQPEIEDDGKTQCSVKTTIQHRPFFEEEDACLFLYGDPPYAATGNPSLQKSLTSSTANGDRSVTHPDKDNN